MKADIDDAAAPDFGPFMTNLVKADYHLGAATGIYTNMTEQPNVYGNKRRFQAAGEEHAKLAVEYRTKASDALQAILDERLAHLDNLHVAEEVQASTFSLHFASGSSAITSTGQKALRDAVALLKEYPHSQVGVVAYTDTVSSEAYNKGLAGRRAQSVYNALIAMGAPRKALDTSGITTTAVGEADGPDNTASKENRRVDVIIQPHSRPLP